MNPWQRDYHDRMVRAWEAGGACLYVLQRHGGARGHRWRASAWGAFRDVEWAAQKQLERLRQGSLRMVATDGTILWTVTAPRLRSRW